MLIDIRTSELQSNNWNSIPLALFVAILLNYTIFQILPYYIAIINNYYSNISNIIYYIPRSKYIDIITNAATPFGVCEAHLKKNLGLNKANVMFVTSNGWDGNITETSHISTIGNILYTSYSIWLFIVSVLLLLSMIGTILITLNKKSVK